MGNSKMPSQGFLRGGKFETENLEDLQGLLVWVGMAIARVWCPAHYHQLSVL